MPNFIAFVPGLQSDEDARKGNRSRNGIPPENTYAYQAYSVAQEMRVPFHYLPIQTTENPAPLLSEMGDMIAQSLWALQTDNSQGGTIVTSSVGTGALLTTFSKEYCLIAPNVLFTLEGVFNPLSSIPQWVQRNPATKEKFEEMLRGERDYFELPVNNSTGHFHLTLAHLNDPRVSNIFNPRFAHSDGISDPNRPWRKIGHLFNMTAENNPLCPPKATDAFGKIAAPYTNIIYPTIIRGDTQVTQEQFRDALRRSVRLAWKLET